MNIQTYLPTPEDVEDWRRSPDGMYGSLKAAFDDMDVSWNDDLEKLNPDSKGHVYRLDVARELNDQEMFLCIKELEGAGWMVLSFNDVGRHVGQDSTFIFIAPARFGKRIKSEETK